MEKIKKDKTGNNRKVMKALHSIVYYFVMFVMLFFCLALPYNFQWPSFWMESKYLDAHTIVFSASVCVTVMGIFYLLAEKWSQIKSFEKILWMIFMIITPFFVSQIYSIHALNNAVIVSVSGGNND